MNDHFQLGCEAGYEMGVRHRMQGRSHLDHLDHPCPVFAKGFATGYRDGFGHHVEHEPAQEIL